jgi:hypothetical protein
MEMNLSLENNPVAFAVKNFVVGIKFAKELIGGLLWYLPGIIADPFNTIFTISVYAAVITIWSLAATPLAILQWLELITDQNPILWADPQLFQHMPPDRVAHAKSILASSAQNMFLDSDTKRPVGEFSVDVAQLLLLMSALMYLRVSNSNNEEEALREIRKQAKAWNLKFEFVAQLAGGRFGGPFCGMFSSEGPTPFVVVAFKGTTPFDYAEWAGDFDITRTVAPFLDGRVHKGFYDKLFPDLDTKAARKHPYGEIIDALKEKIKALGSETKQPVPVWVTGHSLGAAMATVFVSRLLKCPGDLDLDTYQLMDCYNFGCPAIGDSDYAIAVESNQNMPISRKSVIWRFIDDADIVTRVPLAYENINILSRLDVDTFHNYAHVGVPIRLYWKGTKPTVYPQFYSTGIKVQMYAFNGEREISKPLMKTRWNFLGAVFSSFLYLLPVAFTGNYDNEKPASLVIWLGRLVVPKYGLDHFPHRYYESLDKARQLSTCK